MRGQAKVWLPEKGGFHLTQVHNIVIDFVLDLTLDGIGYAAVGLISTVTNLAAPSHVSQYWI